MASGVLYPSSPNSLLILRSPSSSSQKPADDLYAAFKRKFFRTGTGQPASSPSRASVSEGMNHHGQGNLMPTSDFDVEHTKDSAGYQSPAMIDQHGLPFGTFAPPASGYYTPTSGDSGTAYHHHSGGELQSHGMGLQVDTPLSISLQDSSLNAVPSFDLSGFNPNMLQSHHFQQPYMYSPQQAFQSRMLGQQDAHYGPSSSTSNLERGELKHHKLEPRHSTGTFDLGGVGMSSLPLPAENKFRFHVTLNAPTAMIRDPDEIPVTYLNKGQAYTVSIIDTKPKRNPQGQPVKYRTVVRISFEDEQQRQRPAACWQLWKEGRGLAEAQNRDGKLQAVEFVDPYPGAEKDPRKPRIELESSSFDSFAINWTPSAASAQSDCSIAVRFNFLSTDFSHSKGVKGVPVRFCAKTNPVNDSEEGAPAESETEVCHCKVKLFRDHGAERKLSNDIAHVKKTIEKLKQQIAQAESGYKDSGKRKRKLSLAASMGSDRPSKMRKGARRWSISSHGSGERQGPEDDLTNRLNAMQDMFTSTRNVSVLNLDCDEQDDPDLYPVALPSESQDLMKLMDEALTGSPEMSNFSPSDSKHTFSRGLGDTRPRSATIPSTDYRSLERARLAGPIKLERKDKSGTFETTGVDPTYVPPREVSKAIASLHILFKGISTVPNDGLYRAIYLDARTTTDFISQVTAACEIDPAQIQRVVRIHPRGMKILVEEKVIRELPEAQDMIVEFQDMESDASVSHRLGAPFDPSAPLSQHLEMLLRY